MRGLLTQVREYLATSVLVEMTYYASALASFAFALWVMLDTLR